MAVTVFRLLGVPVRLHGTLLVVVGWLGVLGGKQGWPALERVLGPLLVLYASVLVHELGHALVARRHSVATRAITLHVLGGSAQLEARRVPSHVDLVVSLAGPLTNLAVAVPCLILGAWLPWELVRTAGAVNLLLGVLNLLPAFPLDGGRVLRALLVPRLGLAAANRLALSVGFVFAVAIGVAGVALRQPWLVPLAAFMALLQRREQRIQAMLGSRPEWA